MQVSPVVEGARHKLGPFSTRMLCGAPRPAVIRSTTATTCSPVMPCPTSMANFRGEIIDHGQRAMRRPSKSASETKSIDQPFVNCPGRRPGVRCAAITWRRAAAVACSAFFAIQPVYALWLIASLHAGAVCIAGNSRSDARRGEIPNALAQCGLVARIDW